MGDGKSWIDLLDPTADEVEAAAGVRLDQRELAVLVGSGEPRPRFFGTDDHAIGAFVVPVAVKDEDRVYYQEVDLVLTATRRSPCGGHPRMASRSIPTELKETCEGQDVPPGKVAFHLADIVAERYLDLIDDLNEEIDEVEDVVEREFRSGGRASAALRAPPRHPAHPSDALADARRGPSSRGRQGPGRGARAAGRARDRAVQRRLRQAPPRERRARALTRSGRRRPRLLPVEGRRRARTRSCSG